MKKNVIVFGLISGLIVAVMMVISTLLCYNSGNFEGSMIMGYASMILAFSLIFVAIKNYRDKFNGGYVSFLKALKIGLLISLIGSTVYVATWLVEYYVFMPDFMERYSAAMLEKARAGGESAAEIREQTEMIEQSKKIYATPLGVILFTYMEVLPVGILVSLLCALILKRKDPGKGNAVQPAV
jgi:hypothetical protein